MTLIIREHVLLRDLTTFRIGGNARFFTSVTTREELVQALNFAKGKGFFILGGGSNVLISDQGFSGLVIEMKIMGREIIQAERGSNVGGGTIIKAGAGENWDSIVGYCVEHGCFGIENLSGIPGSVGAAPVQNIGAYGVEVAEAIDRVEVFDRVTNTFRTLSRDECGFAYRDSVFKHEKNPDGGMRYIIVAVNFALHQQVSVNLEYKDIREYFSGKEVIDPIEVREAVLAIRSAKLPDVNKVGTAGSYFKNPFISLSTYNALKANYKDMPCYPTDNKDIVKVPLGWILEHICGYKGTTKGYVGTYRKQALVIVNNFSIDPTVGVIGATAKEVKGFADEIIVLVKDKTGIDIEPEVQYVG